MNKVSSFVSQVASYICYPFQTIGKSCLELAQKVNLWFQGFTDAQIDQAVSKAIKKEEACNLSTPDTSFNPPSMQSLREKYPKFAHLLPDELDQDQKNLFGSVDKSSIEPLRKEESSFQETLSNDGFTDEESSSESGPENSPQKKLSIREKNSSFEEILSDDDLPLDPKPLSHEDKDLHRRIDRIRFLAFPNKKTFDPEILEKINSKIEEKIGIRNIRKILHSLNDFKLSLENFKIFKDEEDFTRNNVFDRNIESRAKKYRQRSDQERPDFYGIDPQKLDQVKIIVNEKNWNNIKKEKDYNKTVAEIQTETGLPSHICAFILDPKIYTPITENIRSQLYDSIRENNEDLLLIPKGNNELEIKLNLTPTEEIELSVTLKTPSFWINREEESLHKVGKATASFSYRFAIDDQKELKINSFTLHEMTFHKEKDLISRCF